MNYSWLVALHIIFVVTWFAGLFYIVRLLIYHSEALQKKEPDKSVLVNQFILMEKRLMHIITTPSMILVLISGGSLLAIHHDYLTQGWMQLKLVFVACTVIYHFICLRRMKELSTGEAKWSSQKLRLYNELATLFLVAVVFLIEMRSTLDMLTGLGIFILFAILLFVAIRIYKKRREKNQRD